MGINTKWERNKLTNRKSTKINVQKLKQESNKYVTTLEKLQLVEYISGDWDKLKQNLTDIIRETATFNGGEFKPHEE